MTAGDQTERAGAGGDQDELLRRVARAEEELESARDREAALGRALAESEAEVAEQRANVARLTHEVAYLEGAASERRSAQARARELERALAAIKSSSSWRVTKPLRRLRGGAEPGS